MLYKVLGFLLKEGEELDKQDSNIRFNLLILAIYVIGIILLVQLFNLQIIKGDEYREQSNTRLTRESVLEAARGNIYDRTGEKLVSSKMQFDLALYKTKIDNITLNNAILNMISILEKNGDKFLDDLPIKVNPFEYTIEGDVLLNWKKSNKIKEEASAEEAFNFFKQKFEIDE